HVLRATEWTESLRDLVTSILETNLTIQGNRLNIITKKVTGWAAIIAVPTLITGYFGMNVPYPGFGKQAGFALSVVAMIGAGLVLSFVFKRKDWLWGRGMAGRGRDPGRSVPSRVLAVLSAFDDSHPRLRLSEVARRSGLPVSTVSRLLAELVAGEALARR